MDGPSAQGFLSLTGPLAPRVADCPSGNTYKVSVTGLAFYVIGHDWHSADWLAALASPYPGCAGLPPVQGEEWVSMLSCRGMAPWLSTHSPPAGGKVVAPATKRGAFPTPAGRLYDFRRQRRHKKWRLWRRTSPAQRYYIPPEGESPQPVREASAGPGQNPGSPGPKARRLAQPSRP